MEELNTNKKPYKDLSAGVITHYFVLLSRGTNQKYALEKAQTKTYDELNKLTKADSYIMAASEAIQKHMFVGFNVPSFAEIVRGDIDEAGTGFLDSLGNEVWNRNDEGGRILLERMLDCNKELHEKWVMENVNTYNKDDNKLYLYLPFELIGIEGINKYFLYMAPLFEKFGLPIGKMDESPYGEFRCHDSMMAVYSDGVDKFLSDNKITSKVDLKNYLKNLAKNYELLNPSKAPVGMESEAKARIEYLTADDKVEKLVKQIIENNTDVFENFDKTDTLEK